MKIEALSAKQIFEKQSHYDVLHHQKRIAELSSNAHCMFDKNLLAQSKAIIANPCLGYRSVDLSNEVHIADLDQFEESNQQVA